METAVIQETAFALKEENLAQIGSYVKANLVDWLKEGSVLSFEAYRSSMENQALLERIVRVEEGLKSQGQILETILHQMDKRFEQVDKRFEQVDKRFEEFDKRFEQMNRNINNLFFYITTTGVVLAGIMTLYKFIPA